MGRLAKYGIDVRRIEKGWTLDREQLAEILDATPGTQRFGFRVLALREEIRRQFDRLGRRGWQVAQVKGCLRVLTDEEAVAYAARWRDTAYAAAVRAYGVAKGVDQAGLSEEARRYHAHVSETCWRQVVALNEVRERHGLPSAEVSAPPPAWLEDDKTRHG